jgi:hypothetical protein
VAIEELKPNVPAPEQDSGSSKLAPTDLRGLKFLKRMRRMMAALRPCATHQNRRLHFDDYATMVLMYFFSPAIESLRDLQQASGFQKVQKALGIRRMSLGSMSESVRVFDPELLQKVFEDLAGQAPERATDARLKDLRQVLTVVDATLLPALPRMTWAVWLGDRGRGVKAHVQFEVLKGTAVHAEVTPGQGSEVGCLKANLEAGRLYVTDRGYRDSELLEEIVEAGSSFVSRLPDNARYEVVEEKTLSPEAVKARVRSDRIVRLGCEASREKFDRPVRLVEVHVPESPPRGLRLPVKQVSSKKTYREPAGHAYTLLLVTDRLDLPADVIALIFLHRWKVELFFRLLKSVMGCRHLLSDSFEGVSIQVYAALIATLLLAEHTGLAPRKRVYFIVAMYLQGWVTDEELIREIERLKQQDALKKT